MGFYRFRLFWAKIGISQQVLVFFEDRIFKGVLKEAERAACGEVDSLGYYCYISFAMNGFSKIKDFFSGGEEVQAARAKMRGMEEKKGQNGALRLRNERQLDAARKIVRRHVTKLVG
ncbi:hypothetical protein HYV58_00840, partial [Candidatus Peregrinibacteria bacterium]|nr:hypothetical protein [Candidatus Peregrinibacteria bacterium]